MKIKVRTVKGQMFMRGSCILFVFAVVSKPSDCIFPYDFKEAVRKKVSCDGLSEPSFTNTDNLQNVLSVPINRSTSTFYSALTFSIICTENFVRIDGDYILAAQHFSSAYAM